MRMTVVALSLACGIGLAGWQSARAAPASGAAIEEAATAASTVQRTQYAYRRTKHGFEKCYKRNRFGSRRRRWFSSVPDC
jgi:hypothetical protein